MKIYYPINGVKQEKNMDCWIACYTILKRWKYNNLNFQLTDSSAELGDPYAIYYRTNTGLPQKDVPNFILRGRLAFDNPQNYSMQGWFSLLKNKGPLLVISATELQNQHLLGLHARILVGLDDSNDVANPDFIFIDPSPSEPLETTTTFIHFLNLYQAIPSSQLSLIQIIYNL